MENINIINFRIPKNEDFEKLSEQSDLNTLDTALKPQNEEFNHSKYLKNHTEKYLASDPFDAYSKYQSSVNCKSPIKYDVNGIHLNIKASETFENAKLKDIDSKGHVVENQEGATPIGDNFSSSPNTSLFETENTYGFYLKSHPPKNHERVMKFSCYDCDFKCNGKQLLWKHVALTHKRMKYHECTKCESLFFKSSSLRLHMKTVHKEKKLFYCLTCDAKFSTNEDLKTNTNTLHEPLKSTKKIKNLQKKLKRLKMCQRSETPLFEEFHILKPKVSNNVKKDQNLPKNHKIFNQTETVHTSTNFESIRKTAVVMIDKLKDTEIDTWSASGENTSLKSPNQSDTELNNDSLIENVSIESLK